MAKSKLELALKFLTDKSGISQARAEIGFLIDRIKGLKDAAQSTFTFIKGAVSAAFLPLKAVAVPALGAVTAGFGLAIKAIKEFAGQELGETDVKSALVAMGQYTDRYRDKLLKLSDTYQSTTGIADDMWLKSFGQLTRFGMTAANVDKVSTALKNLTGLMDGNLDGATDMLAKAMQGEFSMFSRYGIIIKKTGDDVKDLDAAIAAINAKGVGLLEARAATLSGKWEVLKNQANEVFEAIGIKLAGSLEIGDAVDLAKKKLQQLTTAISDGNLGTIITAAGESFRKKMEDAFKWAEQIATAIKDSGKPVEVVFSDALRAAAEVFVNSLGSLLMASLAIWKLIGKTIAATFKEELLQIEVPGLGGLGGKNRKGWAEYNAKEMTDEDAAAVLVKNGIISAEMAKNPDFTGSWSGRLESAVSGGELSRSAEAELGAQTSSAEITAALNDFTMELKLIGASLKADAAAAVNSAVGIKPPGESLMKAQMDPAPEKVEEKLRVEVGGALFIGDQKGLEEFINKLRESDAALADMVKQAAESQAQLKEAAKTATDQVSATTAAGAAIQAALAASVVASQSTASAATRTQEQLVSTIGIVGALVSSISSTASRLTSLESTVRSMKV